MVVYSGALPSLCQVASALCPCVVSCPHPLLAQPGNLHTMSCHNFAHNVKHSMLLGNSSISVLSRALNGGLCVQLLIVSLLLVSLLIVIITHLRSLSLSFLRSASLLRYVNMPFLSMSALFLSVFLASPSHHSALLCFLWLPLTSFGTSVLSLLSFLLSRRTHSQDNMVPWHNLLLSVQFSFFGSLSLFSFLIYLLCLSISSF